MTDTPLDRAYIAMEAAPQDDAMRLRFFERLADADLFLLLEDEATGDQIRPRIFPVEDQRFVLLFDLEERLTAFAEGAAPYAALSGRSVAAMLAGQELGIGLNLGTAPSSTLLPAEAVLWLSDMLAEGPEERSETPESLHPPSDLPEVLITALDTKLGLAGGLARLAYLAGVTYADGRRSHILAFVDPVPGAEEALARAVREALVFSGIEAGVLDVAFFRSSDALTAPLARYGLRFDLPEPEPDPAAPGAPGMDPDRPPILK